MKKNLRILKLGNFYDAIVKQNLQKGSILQPVAGNVSPSALMFNKKQKSEGLMFPVIGCGQPAVLLLVPPLIFFPIRHLCPLPRFEVSTVNSDCI